MVAFATTGSGAARGPAASVGEEGESNDTEQVQDQHRDAVDAQARVLLGRAKQQTRHIHHSQQSCQRRELQVAVVRVRQDGLATDDSREQESYLG